MIDPQPLGPTVTWTIRDVPTAIRDHVVDATPRGAKVADTLTRLVLHGAHGLDASYVSDKKSNVSDGILKVSDGDLAALATAAATLASADLPPGLKREAFAALRARFRAARGMPPTIAKPRQARLTDQAEG